METAWWLDPIKLPVFATTHWSTVKNCQQANKELAREALGEVCQAYWQPVYACVRHHGYSGHDAEDLTQDFFLQLLGGKYFEHVDQSKGRFRAYLSTALQNFLRDRQRRRWTWRRGRGVVIISLDAQEAESVYTLPHATRLTPEVLYERQWARMVIEHVLEQLKIELTADRKEILFAHFEAVLAGDTSKFSYATVAKDLNLTVDALHTALHRWRRRFRALMREEVARTVFSKTEIENELKHLMSVFAGDM